MEQRLRVKFRKFAKQVNEDAEEMGMHYGFPVAGFFEKREDVVICDAVVSALNEGFEKRERSKESESSEVVAEEPEAQENVEQETETNGLRFHTSWDTILPWKGQFGKVEVFYNPETGKYKKEFTPYGRASAQRRLRYTLMTQIRHEFYGTLQSERIANAVLRKLLSLEQWTSYKLTGSFWEVSKRSGISYFIRKCRPTLVFREVVRPPKDDKPGTLMDALGALCLHPIGYHQKSFAGLMAPSDEVKNFVELIRINEKFLWRKANHHSLREVESGL